MADLTQRQVEALAHCMFFLRDLGFDLDTVKRAADAAWTVKAGQLPDATMFAWMHGKPNGYKTDSCRTWPAIGRCANCGRAHDGGVIPSPADQPRRVMSAVVPQKSMPQLPTQHCNVTEPNWPNHADTEPWPSGWDGRDKSAFQRAIGASQGPTMKLPNVEIVSSEVHAAWMDSKRAQGVTTRKAEDGEELMVPYEQLSDKAKELDRGTVRAVYAAIERAGGA